MNIEPLAAEENRVRRYVRELWLPYHRDLESIADRHALADEPDSELVAAETEFRLDLLESDDHRAWVAVDDSEQHSDPATDGPATDDPATDDPATDDPATDGPATDGPATDDPATDDPREDGPLVGFVTTDIEESPPVFDRPDAVRVGDIYVRERYRGTGLARRLIERAVRRAREAGCAELALDVDVDNDRAIAFYRKLGFETDRRQMVTPVEALQGDRQ